MLFTIKCQQIQIENKKKKSFHGEDKFSKLSYM